MSDVVGPADDSARLRSLLDRLPALIGYWDRQQRNVIANDAYVDYFGITPAQARGTHLRDVVGETLYALNLPHVEAVLRGEEQLFECQLTDVRGRTRHTQVSYVPDVVDGDVAGFYVLVTDVTVRVEAERARDDALRLFQISMDNAPFGKAVLTTSAVVLQINPALCTLLGSRAEELIGTDARDLIHPEDRPSADADLAALLDGATPQVSCERRYLRRDGSTIWLQRNAVRVSGARGGEDVVVAQFQDVTARRRAEAELARLASTDPLTGVHNRHALTDHMGRLHRATPDATVGIVFIDFDGFKQVNDGYGHAAGDGVLVRAAELLTSVVTFPNSAYRLGGDEFVVLVVEPAAVGDVETLAEAIRVALTGNYPTAPTVRLTATVGWTRGGIGDVDGLLRTADADMYRRKPRSASPIRRHASTPSRSRPAHRPPTP